VSTEKTTEILHDAIDAEERARADIRGVVQEMWTKDLRGIMETLAPLVATEPPHVQLVRACEVLVARVAVATAPRARGAAAQGYRIGLKLRRKSDAR